MSYLDSNYYDCNKNDNLGLEPRLMEYMKKKQFFRENNIDPSLLEKEFAITKSDLNKIKAYMKGDKEKYSNSHTDMIDYSKAQFPSDEFKKDPRMDRIKAKQKRENDASEQRHDYGIISKSYDMYRNDRPFASASGNDFSKSSFHPNDWFKSSRDEMVERDLQNDFLSSGKSSFSENNTYVNPRSSYNGYLDSHTTISNNSHTIDEILGKIDSYKKNSEYIPKRENPMDINYNLNIKSRRSTENNYKPLPFMSNSNLVDAPPNGGIRDMDVDSDMRFGITPMRAGKSLGYPSVMEHSFSYITPDIQDPNHVVSDRGIASRGFNKETARPLLNRDPMR